ncbi:hypothetical protein VNO80_07173 [Phaseolus coccineus]|uniref:Uncharacterized protein n=1 Tax=Phaseolus coccineus TaxID=3886 RepID=A0AAN9NN46_PHACN
MYSFSSVSNSFSAKSGGVSREVSNYFVDLSNLDSSDYGNTNELSQVNRGLGVREMSVCKSFDTVCDKAYFKELRLKRQKQRQGSCREPCANSSFPNH